MALVVVIIILILLKNISKSASDAASHDRSMTAEEEPAIFDPMTPPSHMPIYMAGVDDVGQTTHVADFTSVPTCVKYPQIEYTPTGITPIDKKMTMSEVTRLEQRSDIDPVFADVIQQENIKEAVKDALMFEAKEAVQTIKNKYEGERTFICTLDVNNECKDFQPDLCNQWARNNECIINPEFMLENCPSACRACNMTAGERNVLINIYNSRDPINCVSHGGYKLTGDAANHHE